jgi:membrane fusion protein (multidrug efflux system)
MRKESPAFGESAVMRSSPALVIFLTLAGAIVTTAGAQDRRNPNDAITEISGTVVPARTVDVSPRFDGLLIKIHFVPGQFVEKGALLFEFDPALYELSLARERSKLNRAEAQLRLAELHLGNKKTLRVQSVTPEMQVREAEAARDVAAADAAEARCAVEMAEAAVKEMKLYAPISGIISRSFVSEGTVITKVARQQTTLAQIIQRDPIRVVSRVPVAASLPSNEVLSAGQQSKERVEVSLILPDGSRFLHSGRISGEGYEIVPETQMIEIMSEFPNPDNRLRPGQTVTLRFNNNANAGGALATLSQPVALGCGGSGNHADASTDCRSAR